VNFDRRRAKACRSFDLMQLGGDEQRNPNAGIAKLGDDGAEQIMLTGDFEATFGGAFGALLGHQATGMWPRLERNRQHFGRRRHLHVERYGQICRQPFDILVGDVTAVLAQMRRDVVGACFDRNQCRAQRIGMVPSPRIAQRRDVIDVDAEADGKRRGHGTAPRVPTTGRRCRK
jgi:hypothetical protein